MNEAAKMTAGILYNATSVTEKGNFIEHSLLSSVTALQEELEKMGYCVRLFDGDVGMEHLGRESDNVSFVIDFVPWTRSNQKICSPSLLNFYHIPFIGNESGSASFKMNSLL